VRRIWLIALLALLGSAVPVKTVKAAKRDLQKQVAERAADRSRLVDFGVVLVVVRRACACEPPLRDDGTMAPFECDHGLDLIPGKPRLEIVRKHPLGGMVDCGLDQPDYVGPSKNPVRWICSEDQEPLILHPESMPPRICARGSMGSGKTTSGGMWLGVRLLSRIGLPVKGMGVTAPTSKRMGEVKDAIMGAVKPDGTRVPGLWPQRWWRWKEREQVLFTACGIPIDFVSTHLQSLAQGSSVQGQNWSDSLNDELQDCLAEDSNIEARGREAPWGRYNRFAPCTEKDDPLWRTWRSEREKHQVWGMYELDGPKQPFAFQTYWDSLKYTMSDEDYARKIGREDRAAKNRVYFLFDRSRNLMPVPDIGVDVSIPILNIYEPYLHPHLRGMARFTMLAGHDPGEIVNVTHLLRPYWKKSARDKRSRVLWWVVDKFRTERTTAEQHAKALVEFVQAKYGLNYKPDPRDPSTGHDRLLVMLDPHGRGDSKTDYQTVYTAFQRYDLDVFSAATGDAQVIYRKPRIEMMNRLFFPADHHPRLFVACAGDEAKTPLCPELVTSLEQLKRNTAGEAERGRKGKTDQTHDPVSVAYALWPFEQEDFQKATWERAARGRG
jgi:hypothetical protein